jgi:predicted Zn-dependent peptidase
LLRSFGGAAAAAAKTFPPSTPAIYIAPLNDEFSVRLYKKNLEATVVCVGFRICDITHSDKYILNLLKFILIGSSRSRFYAILRDKYGLTYKTSVETTYYAAAGDMTIYTQTNPQNLPRLLKEMVEILCDIKKHGVSTDELKTAKGYLKGLLTRHLENNDYLAEHNGKELFYAVADGVSYIDKYKTYYEPIRVGDIQHIAQQYLRRENCCVAICGAKLPTKNNIEKYFATL